MLQKYLNHAKIKSRKSDNFAHPVNDSKSTVGKEKDDEDMFNFSLGDISNTIQSEISGVNRIRDSLDSISQPAVRSLFEAVRQHNIPPAVSPPPPPQPKIKKIKSKTMRRLQPYRQNSTIATRKRRAEISLSADMSRMKPCKVVIQRLNWEPTAAR